MRVTTKSDAALQEAVSFLRGSQGAGVLVPLSSGEIVPQDRWSVGCNLLSTYSWHDGTNKSQALKHLRLAEEMADLDQKEAAVTNLQEVFNYLLLDRFSTGQVEAREFWWDQRDYRELDLDNDRVELPTRVYEILDQLRNVGLPLQMKVLQYNPRPVDPIFVVSLFERKWFKLHEWE